MTSLSKSTKFAAIFGAVGIAIGVGVTLVVLLNDEGEGIMQIVV